jgi:hypothetical protein
MSEALAVLADSYEGIRIRITKGNCVAVGEQLRRQSRCQWRDSDPPGVRLG